MAQAKSKNAALRKADRTKEDEFYTILSYIEKELKYYKEHFKGKTIFCNCDDPESSNFCRYFQLNFYQLGIKKLISTHYDAEKTSYKLEIVSSENGSTGQISLPEFIRTPLKQNGDFRSPECIEILQEADIVVTNPPFSLFREYVAQLVEYGKKFLIIGSQNNVTYKEIFPLLKDNIMWLGYNNGDMEFVVPDHYEPRATRYREENGVKYRSMGNICWFTNLDIQKRHEDLVLFKTYQGNEDYYYKYVNYDGINVDKLIDIPIDYDGNIGVPITFFQRYNPDQFEIVGSDVTLREPMENYANKGEYNPGGNVFYIEKPSNGFKYSCTYKRIVIRHKRAVR